VNTAILQGSSSGAIVIVLPLRIANIFAAPYAVDDAGLYGRAAEVRLLRQLNHLASLWRVDRSLRDYIALRLGFPALVRGVDRIGNHHQLGAGELLNQGLGDLRHNGGGCTAISGHAHVFTDASQFSVVCHFAAPYAVEYRFRSGVIIAHLPERVKHYFVIICTLVRAVTIYLQGAAFAVVIS
jgi:hypothetical protein